jgi:anti-sigma regulatory factor (Ser/Thr protein kinase)/CheY-like chemotaxis protein
MTRHVLIAEAASAAGALLRRHLRQKGFLIRTADSPCRALASARRHRPDLVVLASHELLRDLRFHRETAGLAVVQIGRAEGAGRLRVEPDAAVRGPLTPEALSSAIDSALEARAERLREGIASDLSVWLPSDAAELEAFNERLAAWLAGCGLTTFQTKQLALAAREIVANAIEWGHGYERARLVSVACRLDSEKVTILVRDTGPGFDRHNLPHAARHGDPLSHLEVRASLKLREGGFGILMASGLVDHLCYNDTGNEGLLVKYLPRAVYPAASLFSGAAPSSIAP